MNTEHVYQPGGLPALVRRVACALGAAHATHRTAKADSVRRRALEPYRRAFESFAIPLVVSDRSGRYQWLNRAAGDLGGSARSRITLSCPGLGTVGIDRLIDEALDGLCLDELPMRWLGTLRGDLPVAVTTQQLRSSRRRVEGALVVLRDETLQLARRRSCTKRHGSIR